MSEMRWKVAGRLAVLHAVLGVSLMAGTMAIFAAQGAERISERDGKTMIAVGMVVGAVSFAALHTLFRLLLERRYGFYSVSGLIWALIGLNALAAVTTIVDAVVLLAQPVSMAFGLGGTIAIGLVMIVYGVRLRRLPDDLFGLRDPYCYATITAGVCFAAGVLAPIGAVAAAVASVVLARVFFRAIGESEAEYGLDDRGGAMSGSEV